MYRKLVQKFGKSYRKVQHSVRTLRTSTTYAATQTTPDETQEINRRIQTDVITEQTRPEDTSDKEKELFVEKSTSTCSKHGSEGNLWVEVLNSEKYQNWLKVGLAIRTACDFVAPVVEKVVEDMHSHLVEKHGSSTSNNFRPYSDHLLERWILDVSNFHRKRPSSSHLRRSCDVSKWPTPEGCWEVAKVFMTSGFQAKGTFGANSFDASALFNFMKNCRLMQNYVGDFSNVTNVIQARNNAMHCPRMEVTNEELEKQFDLILSLWKDASLKFYVDQTLDSNLLLSNLLQLKALSFNVTSAARNTLNLLEDQVIKPANPDLLNPSAKTASLTSLRSFVANMLAKTANANRSAGRVTSLSHQSDVRDRFVWSPTQQRNPLGEYVKKLQQSFPKHPAAAVAPLIYRSVSETSLRPKNSRQVLYQTVDGHSTSLGVPMATFQTQQMFHDLCSARQTRSKRKANDGKKDDDKPGTSAKKRRFNEDKPFTSEKKKAFGGGGSGASFTEKLNSFLSKQANNEGALFKDKVDEEGKFHSTVEFFSNFSILGSTPRDSVEEAEEEAAAAALMWLGKDVSTRGNCKLLFDTYCHHFCQAAPVYKTRAVSGALYMTLLQMINSHSIHQIEVLSPQRVFLKVSCELHEHTKDQLRRMTAKCGLEEAGIKTDQILDIQGAFSEFCLNSGGTLPIYEFDERCDLENIDIRRKCTATSFTKDCLTSHLTVPYDHNSVENLSDECDAYATNLMYPDLIEGTSLLPRRSVKLSQDSAAKNILQRLGQDTSKPDNLLNFTEKLKRYADYVELIPVYHTFQITPLFHTATQYECVTSSPCLHSTNQEFSVRSETSGFANAVEARESAARNALFMLDQLTC